MKTDVCLITEATYPYVHGGVSAWIHNLISSLSNLSFSVVNISSVGDSLRTPKYKIPPNILELKEVFVHDFEETQFKRRGNEDHAWKTLEEFYRQIDSNQFSDFDSLYRSVVSRKSRLLSVHDVIRSKKTWKLLTDYFVRAAGDASFVDYFWTMRFIHTPLLKIFDSEIPDARIYHPVCTGYAGLYSVLAKLERKRPFILTEHGIYTHERKIEIRNARWIYSPEDRLSRANVSMGFLKDLWIKKFDFLSRLTYKYADRIVTLFEGNRKMQIEGGADPAKTEIIPNGTQAAEAPLKNAPGKPPVIGFVGRVVPIKDVKTFIRAMKILAEELPGLRVYIMGAMDEDEKYAEECRILADTLNLGEVLSFEGNVDVSRYYPKMDVIILTSISEAQPLSVLEAMGHGIPVVASDVGGCRELIYGGSDEDRLLGASGIVTSVGNPIETAGAVKSILKSEKRWREMSVAGWSRVKRYYTSVRMIDDYRSLYESFLMRQQVR